MLHTLQYPRFFHTPTVFYTQACSCFMYIVPSTLSTSAHQQHIYMHTYMPTHKRAYTAKHKRRQQRGVFRAISVFIKLRYGGAKKLAKPAKKHARGREQRQWRPGTTLRNQHEFLRETFCTHASKRLPNNVSHRADPVLRIIESAKQYTGKQHKHEIAHPLHCVQK